MCELSELVKRVLRLRAGGEQQRHSHHENRSNLASRTEGHSGAMVTKHLLRRGTAGKAPWVAGNETVTQSHRRNPGNTGEGGCKKRQRGRQQLGEQSAKETHALLEQPGVQERRSCWSTRRTGPATLTRMKHQPGVQEFSQVGPRVPKLRSAAAAVPSCATRRCFSGSLRGCVCFEPSPC